LNAHPIFLKLGGSLITEKNRPHTARPQVLARLAAEIAAARAEQPDLRLVLGHGSGSFGHVPARRWGTRAGVNSPEAWFGFIEVWREAAALNHLVMQALEAAGLPALAFPPSACVLALDGSAKGWDLAPLQAALQAGLVPVVYGDVVFDRARGGTILSTEDLFDYLAIRLQPRLILQAGMEPGVWEDYPSRTRLVPEITPQNVGGFEQVLGGSAARDVTGGMASKVRQSLALAEAVPGLEVHIFSGEAAGAVYQGLRGSPGGTAIRAPIPRAP
jgi:isopentenyl phosphate kinase